MTGPTVDDFRMFSLDSGRFLLGLARQQKKEGKRKEARETLKQARKNWGKGYYVIRSRYNRGSSVVNKNSPKKDPLNKTGTPEREARIKEFSTHYETQEKLGTEISPFDLEKFKRGGLTSCGDEV